MWSTSRAHSGLRVLSGCVLCRSRSSAETLQDVVTDSTVPTREGQGELLEETALERIHRKEKCYDGLARERFLAAPEVRQMVGGRLVAQTRELDAFCPGQGLLVVAQQLVPATALTPLLHPTSLAADPEPTKGFPSSSQGRIRSCKPWSASVPSRSRALRSSGPLAHHPSTARNGPMTTTRSRAWEPAIAPPVLQLRLNLRSPTQRTP